MRSISIAILGAGPYGLSISAHFWSRGIPHEIFGDTMSSWRRFMPSKMILRSEPHASNLWDPERRFTFERFCREKGIPYFPSGRPVPIDRFLDYANWFQAYAAPGVQNLHVERLSQGDDGFHLEFSNGTSVSARNVIVATGHRYFCNLPASLSNLPREIFSHSSDHQDLTPFVGKRVAVIGAGQSALETAALLHEQGTDVHIIANSDRIVWNADNDGERSLLQKIINPEAGLGFGWRSVAASELPHIFSMLPRAIRFYLVRRTWGPSGACWLRRRVSGKIPVLTSREIMDARDTGGKARLLLRTSERSEELTFDHVIAATGFRADLRRLPFLDPALIARIAAFEGVPRLNRFGESSVPGLFFAGILAAPTFGPVMRFMFGAKHAAPALARRFASEGLEQRPRRATLAAAD